MEIFCKEIDSIIKEKIDYLEWRLSLLSKEKVQLEKRIQNLKGENQMSLRKVKYATNASGEVFTESGLFHQWGVESSCGPDENGVMDSVAIVELPDGTIKLVLAHLIKFDVEKGNEAQAYIRSISFEDKCY